MKNRLEIGTFLSGALILKFPFFILASKQFLSLQDADLGLGLQLSKLVVQLSAI